MNESFWFLIFLIRRSHSIKHISLNLICCLLLLLFLCVSFVTTTKCFFPFYWFVLGNCSLDAVVVVGGRFKSFTTTSSSSSREACFFCTAEASGVAIFVQSKTAPWLHHHLVTAATAACVSLKDLKVFAILKL